jgi:hypothetical protein
MSSSLVRSESRGDLYSETFEFCQQHVCSTRGHISRFCNILQSRRALLSTESSNLCAIHWCCFAHGLCYFSVNSVQRLCPDRCPHVTTAFIPFVCLVVQPSACFSWWTLCFSAVTAYRSDNVRGRTRNALYTVHLKSLVPTLSAHDCILVLRE